MALLTTDDQREFKRADDQREFERAEEFCRLRGIVPGYKMEDERDGPSVFNRVSRTGHLICHPVGEPDMQSSWALSPERFAERYLDKTT